MAGIAQAVDWHFSAGLHDYSVPQAHSDTFGIDARAAFDETTQGGLHYFGSFDLLVDYDEDELDFDHIPIWWQVHAGTDGRFHESGHAYLGWTANFDTRMNTVSSIERRMTALPALVAGYDGNTFGSKLTTGAGWFFQEIDDDVPKTRGYGREDFRHSVFAYSAAASASVRLGDHWTVAAQARGWWGDDDWLLHEYKGEIRRDTGHWRKGSSVSFTAEYNDINLAPYQDPGLAPILPWDHDVLFRLTLEDAW